MTTSTKLSGSMLAPTPPANGSFPLDHLSECRPLAVAYRQCLRAHGRVTNACRKEARAYLECRMQRGLMAAEDWRALGLSRDDVGGDGAGDGRGDGDRGGAKAGEKKPTAAVPHDADTEKKKGFVAGAGFAKRRKERRNKEESAS